MSNWKLFVVAIVLSICVTGQMTGQSSAQMTVQMTDWIANAMTEAPQAESFEKRALSSVQGMLASDLDTKLAGRPFAIWFKEIIGPNAGVVWQLTECGERIVASEKTGHDLRACAEI